MNTDFRVSVDFFGHHKARKLKKRLGAAALLSLLQLWAYAARVRPDGNLSGMTPEDIEIAADWDGEDGAFVSALEEVGFTDVRRPSDDRQTNADDRPAIFDVVEIRLHDWEDHNQWAADSDDRSDKARFSRLATVNRKAFEELRAKGTTAISKHDYSMLTSVKRPSDDRQTNADEPPTPAPSPAPTHKEKNTTPPGSTGNNNRVRACEDMPEGGVEEIPSGTRFDEDPGIEFVELRTYYDEHIRPEGPIVAFTEYKQLKASRAWPGVPVICDGIDAWAASHPTEADKAYVPGLAKFLREHRWKQKPKSRASPQTYQEKADAALWEKVDQVVKGGGEHGL